MKKIAEAALMRKLEWLAKEGTKSRTRAECKELRANGHVIAMDCVRYHRSMAKLWAAMDKRMQAAARKAIARKTKGYGLRTQRGRRSPEK